MIRFVSCVESLIWCILSQKALPDVLNSPVGDFNFTNVIGKLGDVMYKFPFSLPPFYIAIIRCLGVLEGLALQVRHFVAHTITLTVVEN